MKCEKGVLTYKQVASDAGYPRAFRAVGNALNKNVSGDYIYESKNAKDCYLSADKNYALAAPTYPFSIIRACMKCNDLIKTSYALNRPEIVYCVKCYQQEFV